MESRKPGSAVIGVVLVIALLWFIVFGNMGCIIVLEKEGEIEFGLENKNTIVMRHSTPDTDTAKSQLDLQPKLWSWLFPTPEPKTTPPKDAEEAPAPPPS